MAKLDLPGGQPQTPHDRGVTSMPLGQKEYDGSADVEFDRPVHIVPWGAGTIEYVPFYPDDGVSITVEIKADGTTPPPGTAIGPARAIVAAGTSVAQMILHY